MQGKTRYFANQFITWREEKVIGFTEKPQGDGGFFVLSPKVIDYIDDDNTAWESSPLERLAQENELSAYFHNGFWQPRDTMRDKIYLEELWNTGSPPWKIW
jgi:glucose-1-phosphate cytidylyltransferase